ncbi:hypothetical protein BG842_01625 [Haladaptatus sp. W1]|uniref:primase-associated protein n=1 Tax=Haladaptatus sp. W1 TaxID=1897478 RepID=UPI000849CA56|nr:hypothetical protein BG842_01625 [Haladaptatus sp. W1]
MNRYTLTRYSDGAQPIHVDNLEDLFELPCLAAMDELHEKKPVRKDLYNLVRMTWWLPQYRDASPAEFIKNFEYSIPSGPGMMRKRRSTKFDTNLRTILTVRFPLPMNCTKDDMQRYRIGCDQCPYSIYGSLLFHNEMYEQLDTQSE